MIYALNMRNLLLLITLLAFVVVFFLLFTGFIHPELHMIASHPNIMYGN